MLVSEMDSPVAPLRAGVDALLSTDLDRLDANGLASVMAEYGVQRRRLDAFDAWLVTAVDQRRRDGEFAACTTVDLLVGRLRIDPREAHRRVARDGELSPRRTLTANSSHRC